MSSDDLTKRLMASAEEANDDISAKSFHHTFHPGSDNSQQSAAASSTTAPTAQSGRDVHDTLLARAREKAHLESSLGNGAQFLDYKSSLVGGIGGDREIRRELSLKSREERRARERRFGHHGRYGKHSQSPRQTDRQRYNATGSHETSSSDGGSRQEFNTQTPQSRTSFREPPARGYNPFA